jgi:hypothetical protein
VKADKFLVYFIAVLRGMLGHTADIALPENYYGRK